MTLNLHNFYHPFQKFYLGLFPSQVSNQSDFSGVDMMNEIDLYYQPLEKPWIVVTFWFMKLAVICIGEGVCKKLVTSLNKEVGLLTDVTKLVIIAQMVIYPILHFFELVIITIYPVHEIVGNWFCFLDWLLWGVFMRMGVNNSFVAALMRYLFIVHEEKVKSYGKEKVKRWFLYFSIITPIIQFSLQALEGSPRLSFVNKCYGTDHRVFLIETSTLNVFKRKFLKLDGSYLHVDMLREIGVRICKIVEAIVFILMGFNLTETFFYYKIFKKMNR